MEKSEEEAKLIFSGVQPTGNLHLGNYLGAIKNWVELQKKQNVSFVSLTFMQSQLKIIKIEFLKIRERLLPHT